MTDVAERIPNDVLDAEVGRALADALHALGLAVATNTRPGAAHLLTGPVGPGTKAWLVLAATLRASLHSGDYALVRRA